MPGLDNVLGVRLSWGHETRTGTHFSLLLIASTPEWHTQQKSYLASYCTSMVPRLFSDERKNSTKIVIILRATKRSNNFATKTFWVQKTV